MESKIRNEKFHTKRKFYGNQFRNIESETCRQATMPGHVSSSDEVDDNLFRPHYSTPGIGSVLPSISKLGNMEESSSDGFEDIELEGYRFVDIDILAKAFSAMACPLCLQCCVTVKEDGTKKMGFASHITVLCNSEKCEFS